MDKDQVSSKGSLTGGYFNTSRSRLEMQKKRTEFTQQIRNYKKDLAKLRKELKHTENNINVVVSEMQRTETKHGKPKDVFEKVQGEIRLMKEELVRIEKYKATKERSAAQCKASLESMSSTKAGLEAEIYQELMSTLTV